ncbi:MAG: hypothetical protein Q7S06_01345 [Nanoarchaeota archaeon]|nr:hypothetical protein [Nanoarchaeota archaeon]
MKIVLTPDWFLGKDVIIDVFSFIVLFLFFILSFKNYRLDRNKKSFFLGLGFGLISLAQLATIMTKLILYSDTTIVRQIGQAIITYNVIQSVDIFYYLGFFFYQFFTLLGLYIIYKLPLEKEHKKDFFLTLFFITVVSVMSKDLTYLFRLTSLILLLFITRNYYVVYTLNKSKKTLLLVLAFGILAASQVMFILASPGSLIAVVANIWELISYIILLTLIIRIIHHHGTKKKQNGYNIRYLGNSPGKGRKH